LGDERKEILEGILTQRAQVVTLAASMESVRGKRLDSGRPPLQEIELEAFLDSHGVPPSLKFRSDRVVAVVAKCYTNVELELELEGKGSFCNLWRDSARKGTIRRGERAG
jgi:hypothetical protein